MGKLPTGRKAAKTINPRGATAADWVIRQVRQSVLLAERACIAAAEAALPEGSPQKCEACPTLANKTSSTQANTEPPLYRRTSGIHASLGYSGRLLRKSHVISHLSIADASSLPSRRRLQRTLRSRLLISRTELRGPQTAPLPVFSRLQFGARLLQLLAQGCRHFRIA